MENNGIIFTNSLKFTIYLLKSIRYRYLQFRNCKELFWVGFGTVLKCYRIYKSSNMKKKYVQNYFCHVVYFVVPMTDVSEMSIQNAKLLHIMHFWKGQNLDVKSICPSQSRWKWSSKCMCVSFLLYFHISMCSIDCWDETLHNFDKVIHTKWIFAVWIAPVEGNCFQVLKLCWTIVIHWHSQCWYVLHSERVTLFTVIYSLQNIFK